jgi:hypothetical protein
MLVVCWRALVSNNQQASSPSPISFKRWRMCRWKEAFSTHSFFPYYYYSSNQIWALLCGKFIHSGPFMAINYSHPTPREFSNLFNTFHYSLFTSHFTYFSPLSLFLIREWVGWREKVGINEAVAEFHKSVTKQSPPRLTLSFFLLLSS